MNPGQLYFPTHLLMDSSKHEIHDGTNFHCIFEFHSAINCCTSQNRLLYIGASLLVIVKAARMFSKQFRDMKSLNRKGVPSKASITFVDQKSLLSPKFVVPMKNYRPIQTKNSPYVIFLLSIFLLVSFMMIFSIYSFGNSISKV